MIFITNYQASENLHPGKKSLNFPAASIPAKLSSILGWRLLSVLSMRRNQLNSALFKQLGIKAVAVIGFIANQSIRRILGKAAVDGSLNQLHFMGRSAFNVSGDRKTSSVCDGHDLGAFTALCLADSKTP
jgi:hypothetical protein